MGAKDPTYEVNISTMLDVFGNPMSQYVWGHAPGIESWEVEEFIENGFFRKESMQSHACLLNRAWHIARIAYLVVERHDDPIIIEVSCAPIKDTRNYVWDGNHRLSAAIYRKDPTILVQFSGGVQEFHRLFPEARKVRG